MNHHLKKLTLVVITVFLLTACGAVETPSALAPVVTADSVEMAEPVTGLAPVELSRYIGLRYPPVPETLTEVFAMLIQNAEDHSLSLLSEGETRMLWLSRLTHHDSNGNAYWEVQDVLDLSALEAGLVMLPDGCLLNDVPDHEIFVAGKDGTIQFAWRADTALEKFEVIPATGIRCDSDKALELD